MKFKDLLVLYCNENAGWIIACIILISLGVLLSFIAGVTEKDASLFIQTLFSTTFVTFIMSAMILTFSYIFWCNDYEKREAEQIYTEDVNYFIKKGNDFYVQTDSNIYVLTIDDYKNVQIVDNNKITYTKSNDGHDTFIKNLYITKDNVDKLGIIIANTED